MASARLQALWNHPAGPKTIHFWAPTFKWGISIANIADFTKPTEMISYPQQTAVTCTGLIWSRYSMVITPKNWNLFSVNCLMAATGIYQLSRKIIFQRQLQLNELTVVKMAGDMMTISSVQSTSLQAEEFGGENEGVKEVEKQAA